ncbi:protein kinase domain-containing protein [Streptosporangium lutulentum]|uniref:Serine/threonine protein kinase n=1 Tax=Streptosporangium lutulentum TaxID=1461250 RepID=A0ABT9QSH8_9ACTN|nr:serine/threonine protein kinase [Streptosporangium lutulentum]MDP9849365.1 serine/threonine protein kinase [Streptosporangium lutulentum]
MAGDTQAPERLGPYRLLRKIGEGGMGVVHLGLDEDGREVAVKVLHPHVAADLKARDRLTREVETMRRVRSPHVAEVLDAELTAKQPYIVTRFAPGRTLEETVLEDGPLPADEVIRLAEGMCAALVAIHAADVVHRDFKPSNVMIVNGDPLVIDFGIAHLVNATRLTQTGMFVGTPGYLAPEIIRDSEITQAADVHALASTVFFGATGKPPFGTGSFEVVCFNIMEGRANIDQAPAWLRPWLRQALAVDPTARPSAVALHRMARALDPTVTAFHDTPPTAVHDSGTRVLNTDGTAVLDGQAASPASPAPPSPSPNGTRALPADGTYSDLLPPVEYAKPERRERRPRPEPTRPSAQQGQTAGPPSSPAPATQPPPYVPAPPSAQQVRFAPPPPPYADQRVAGYPAPPPTGQARPYAPPPQSQLRPHNPEPQPRTPPADRPPYRTGHPLAAALLLVIPVALACAFPVVVSVIALVAALCLRVGEYLLGDLAQRRSVRGSSATDPLLAVLGTPWALIKAVLATLVTAPLAAMFGMCVWGVLVYVGGMGVNDAGKDMAAAYAAGAFVAGLFILPGGGKPRRAVSRVLTGAIRSPGAAMVTTIVLGTLAFLAVMTALNVDQASFTPWQRPTDAINDLTDRWKEAANRGTMSALDLIGGLVDDLMNSLGLGFLTFWR